MTLWNLAVENPHRIMLCTEVTIGTESIKVLIDKFFQYYENHYNARLLSKRESDIGEYKRYEVIFKVEI